MRIIIPSVHVPFIFGGAQLMTQGLADALLEHGHEVEIVRFPFKFFPEDYLQKSMDYCASNDFENFNGYPIDLVIALQFPAYYVRHPNKTLWMMHQHRAVYELLHLQNRTPEFEVLRDKIIDFDTRELATFNKRYSMCQNVTNRLQKYNGIDSTPVYHPPAHQQRFICEPSQDFIFCPSRLEAIKRQDLVIRAMQYTRANVSVIIAGKGGQQQVYQQLAESLGVMDKVRFIGHITEDEKYLYYARSLAVFFGAFDEDYGYITLEAMLSAKPVITCKDSGGPLEFVVDNQTGHIVDPAPQQIAEVIDALHSNKAHARQLGQNGLQHYHQQDISWHNVVNTLLS